MANYDKWARGGAGHLLKHFERAKDKDGEYIKFGNRDIDTSRSHLNYNLAPERSEGQYNFIRQRCSEVYCLNRKDVNVLASWIVTAPTTLEPNQYHDFFKSSYEALEEKYGKENVVSAHVHMDESGQPHMHFAFVPIVYDKEKERYTVNAKKCVTRADLKEFHPWLECALERKLGYHVDVINEATKDGNKEISDLKRERELGKQREAERETAAARREAAAARQEAHEARSDAQKASQELSDVQGRVEASKDELEALSKPLMALHGETEELEERTEKKRFPRKCRIVSEDDFQKLVAQSRTAIAQNFKIKELERENQRLRADRERMHDSGKKNIELALENQELRRFKERAEAFLERRGLLEQFREFSRMLRIRNHDRDHEQHR